MPDVIVVGGGPAGVGAAVWMARAGWEVVLLDRARFPRDKACGEFLTPETRSLLRDLGAWEAVCRAGLRPVAAMVLCAPDGSCVRHEPRHGGPAGYSLRRVTLDAVLLEQARAAGVQVREGVTGRELLRDGNGSVCGIIGREADGAPVLLRARLVIGADGAHSLVARQLGLVRALPRLQRVSLVTHWRSVPGAGDTVEMRACGQTVCGLGFPGPACANLTLVVPTTTAARIAGRAGDFVEETIRDHFPDLAPRLAGAEREAAVRTVGCFGHVCRPAVAAGALLVGDAATFIDPFTGEGVYFALRGAQLAAEIAAGALRAGDLSCSRLLAYQRARGELARRYLLCDVVQAAVRCPALFRQVVHRLDRFPGLADRLMGILGDTRPPAEALHPGFLWRLFAPEF
jgi:flavin-dependent dehydrogenase